MNKSLALIHITTAMGLIPKVDDGAAQLELVATYLAPAAALVKAKSDPAAMEPFVAQAAELGAEEAAEIVVDFLRQFTAYCQKLNGPVPEGTKMALSHPGA